MIGAMPAVAVRHERRRQEKRLKRPSQLYLGGQWLPPLQGSPPTPSSHGHNNLESLPELYLCGKVTHSPNADHREANVAKSRRRKMNESLSGGICGQTKVSKKGTLLRDAGNPKAFFSSPFPKCPLMREAFGLA